MESKDHRRRIASSGPRVQQDTGPPVLHALPGRLLSEVIDEFSEGGSTWIEEEDEENEQEPQTESRKEKKGKKKKKEAASHRDEDPPAQRGGAYLMMRRKEFSPKGEPLPNLKGTAQVGNGLWEDKELAKTQGEREERRW